MAQIKTTDPRHATSSKKDERDAIKPQGINYNELAKPAKAVVKIISGSPGCGKSDFMLFEAAHNHGRYLFACSTTDLANEQAARFTAEAPTSAQTVVVHSKSKGKGSVRSRVSKLPSQFAEAVHVAVFITHEALLTTDLTDFVGWHVRIDEYPNAVISGQLRIAKSIGHYRASFQLEPFADTGWSKVKPLGPSATWSELEGDTLGKRIKSFHACAERPADLYLRLMDFEQGSIGGSVPWFSAWTFRELAAFQSISMAAASFRGSILHRVCESCFSDEIVFTDHPISSGVASRATINIYYFTEGHECSTALWDSSEGRRNIAQVRRWMEANLPSLGYWSGNDEVCKLLEHNIAGKFEAPKLAGLNRLRAETSCAFFYSAKPVPDDAPIMDVFCIEAEDIRGTREDEDIFQFVCRGAIRNPDFGGNYDIYLYSRSQAERLAKRLSNAGFSDVQFVGIPQAGIMHEKRSSLLRRSPELSGEEKIARRRAQDRVRQSRHTGRANG